MPSDFNSSILTHAMDHLLQAEVHWFMRQSDIYEVYLDLHRLTEQMSVAIVGCL